MMSMAQGVSARRPVRTGAALLMLLLVTAGLFTMHTLGHFSMPSTMSMSHTAAVDPPPMDHADMHAGLGVSDSLAASLASVPSQPQMPMGSAVACVAILCALIVLAVIAAPAYRVRVRRRSSPLALRLIIGTVRGPPTVLIGLRLADLSVARN